MPSILNGGELPTIPPQILRFASVEFWNSTEVMICLLLIGVFLFLVVLHHAVRALRSFFLKPRSMSDLTSSEHQASQLQEFHVFQRRYIIVYSIAFSVNIMGGPYTYRLYADTHELSDSNIRSLMRVAVLSSAVSCCLTGTVIDILGRRLGLLLCMSVYVGRYILIAFVSSPTAFFASEILYGIAVPLFHSIPECWMIDQHRILQFPDSLLQGTFSTTQIFACLTSICLFHMLNWIRPFVGLIYILGAAAAIAVVNMILILFLWDENTGHATKTSATRREELDPSLAIRLLGLLVASVIQAVTSFQVHSSLYSYAS